MELKKTTIKDILKKKEKKEKICALTAYDFSFASVLDEAGIDIILVGDSLGMVVLGFSSTVYVRMEDMLHHLKAVKRGAKKSFVVCDMPFMSYTVSTEEAIRNAGKLVQEGGADAVKIEGGRDVCETVKRICQCEIPVMGHVGLNPQKILKMGGYFVQGKDNSQEVIQDALAIEEAGAFSVVVECVPEEVAKEMTEKLKIPTIGIGAGRYVDGQILVLNDILGLNKAFKPKFVKTYEDFYTQALKAVKSYIEDVKEQRFPQDDNVYHKKS
ncbi:MAG: 3-methyl-2-oxobutanoate hydroxymethyltransferase [Candidatus Aureabacteria bacterium]|nr:3-methyl-2-oxobutanoate hydroxymethyltransferase [Candidatus Auribacterota bacterium]